MRVIGLVLAHVALLPKVLDAASRYGSRPSDEAMEQLLSRRELVPLFS